MDYPGGFITKTAPTLNPALGNAAPGVWRLNDVLKNIKAGTWPSYDPYFENTTLLLHGNGTNGGQNNTFLDSSSNNFTITRNGNTTQGTFSPFSQTGWGNYFDASGDYLDLPSSANLATSSSDFTIECWAYFNATTNGYIFSGSGATIQLSSGSVISYDGSNHTLGAVSVGQWFHLVVCRSGSTIKAFLNGVQGSSWTNSGTQYTHSSGRLGAEYGTGNTGLNGYISNYRFIVGTALYTADFTPPVSPLTAVTNTKLLTCQSNRFIDNSSNQFTLTVSGTPLVQAFSPFAPTAAYSASTVGGSGYFDGSGDYLTVETAAESALNLTGTFTLEFWFYRNATGDMWFFSKGGGVDSWNTTNGIAYQAIIETSTFKWQFSIGGGSLVSINVTAPAISQWVHVAVGRDGTTTRVWVNGSSIGTSTSTPTPPSTRNIIYAAANQTGGSNANGYMAGLRIVNGTDVYGVSNTSITVPTSPPTNISNTSLLCNFTNAAIIDNTAKNVLETVGNAQISTTQSKFGGASLYFDGTGDWLKAPNSTLVTFGAGDFTVEFWVYMTVSANNTIVGTGGLNWSGSDVQGWSINYSTGSVLSAGLTAVVRGSTTQAGLNFGALSLNTWTHVAISRAGGTLRGFVNGVLGGSQSNNNDPTNTNQLTVGADFNNANTFTGYIDDLRITKGIARYTSNFTPQTSQWQDQ